MDNYKILKFITSGSFGKIYKAISKSSKNIVAIKKITYVGLSHYDKENIFNETKLTLTIEHPHIIKAIDIFIDDNSIFIVFPYYKNKDLKTYIMTYGYLSESKIWKIFGQLVSAIHTLHKNNIIHRDIKIHNILVKDNYDIVLADLGITKILQKYQLNTNTQVGTPYYLSPELINGDRYNKNIDIWSLGIVMYELIYHHYPFAARNLPYLMRKIKMDNIHFPQTNISFRLIELCRKMLDKNPMQRLSSDILYRNILIKPFIKEYPWQKYSKIENILYSNTENFTENIKKIYKPKYQSDFIKEPFPYQTNKCNIGVQVNISTQSDKHDKYKYSLNYHPH